MDSPDVNDDKEETLTPSPETEESTRGSALDGVLGDDSPALSIRELYPEPIRYNLILSLPFGLFLGKN